MKHCVHLNKVSIFLLLIFRERNFCLLHIMKIIFLFLKNKNRLAKKIIVDTLSPLWGSMRRAEGGGGVRGGGEG
jgi:hypothetical protein